MKKIFFLIFLIFSFSVCADDASEIQKKNRAFMKECYTDRGITNIDDLKEYIISHYDLHWKEVRMSNKRDVSIDIAKKSLIFFQKNHNNPCAYSHVNFIARGDDFEGYFNYVINDLDDYEKKTKKYIDSGIKEITKFIKEKEKKSKAMDSL